MINVLIVEDDPMVAAINREFLSRLEGFRLLETFSNGKDCLNYLGEGGEAHLILLDVFMPGMGGLDLLGIIHTQHPGIEVIMITAARSAQDIRTALHLGVVDYLMKPFTFERFQAALLAFQDRRRLLESGRELDQGLLDRRILTRDKPDAPILPKGIDHNTLETIEHALQKLKHDCSIKELEPETGLSRVSLKKYLIYLESTGKASSRLEYPPIGRPVRLYRWL